LNTPINSSLSRAVEKDINSNDIEMEINDNEIPIKYAPVQRDYKFQVFLKAHKSIKDKEEFTKLKVLSILL
jgi:hypothetical protein